MNATMVKPQIIKGKTEIVVPHNEGVITFVYDEHGPGTYANVQSSIESAGLEAPTMAQTASLLHQMYCGELKDAKESEEIKKIIAGKYKWLWCFTGSLYVPNKGVYIQDHPEVRNRLPFMAESELAKKLEAKDQTVRFVPFDFKTGKMSAMELASNSYVMALAGQKGASQLGEIADTFESKPYLYSFESIDQLTTKVSALYFGWDLGGLDVSGNNHGYDFRGGCAFGVSRTQKF